jgi:hypothetical protein
MGAHVPGCHPLTRCTAVAAVCTAPAAHTKRYHSLSHSRAGAAQPPSPDHSSNISLLLAYIIQPSSVSAHWYHVAARRPHQASCAGLPLLLRYIQTILYVCSPGVHANCMPGSTTAAEIRLCKSAHAVGSQYTRLLPLLSTSDKACCTHIKTHHVPAPTCRVPVRGCLQPYPQPMQLLEVSNTSRSRQTVHNKPGTAIGATNSQPPQKPSRNWSANKQQQQQQQQLGSTLQRIIFTCSSMLLPVHSAHSPGQ